MKNFLKVSLLTALVAGMMGFAASTARADDVTFSTVGTISCTGCAGTGTSTVTIGGITLTFAGVASGVTFPPNPSNIGLGAFTASGAGDTGAFAGGSFTLNITQTVPTPGGPSPLISTLTGQITTGGSNAQITFTTFSTTIGAVTYTVQPNLLLISPTANNGAGLGVATLQGTVTAAVPEPASMLLLGSGLVGAAGLVRRRVSGRSPK